MCRSAARRSSSGTRSAALTITALVALYLFGMRRGVTREQAMKMAAESLAPMGALLCIMGGGGAFKQVIVDSGVGAVRWAGC